MTTMGKASEVGRLASPGAEQRSGQKRARAVDSNEAFARAFVDALRDILHDEQRRGAWV